eukprot:14880523-Alexandrium_andersonii.AAC.1
MAFRPQFPSAHTPLQGAHGKKLIKLQVVFSAGHSTALLTFCEPCACMVQRVENRQELEHRLLPSQAPTLHYLLVLRPTQKQSRTKQRGCAQPS